MTNQFPNISTYFVSKILDYIYCFCQEEKSSEKYGLSGDSLIVGLLLSGWRPARTWQTHRELLSQIAVSVELTAQSLLWVTNRPGQAGEGWMWNIFQQEPGWQGDTGHPAHQGSPGGRCNTCCYSGKIRIVSTTQLPFFEHRCLGLDEWCKSQPTVECLSTSVPAQCFFAEVKTRNCSCPTSYGERAAC